VLVNLNGYEYRNTVAVMGGNHMITNSADTRQRRIGKAIALFRAGKQR
jgi:hypothetical protein